MTELAVDCYEVTTMIWVGTSGFAYDEWRGSFYPDGLKAGERLAFYASELQTVELNNTFYRMPSEAAVQAWANAAAAAPHPFRFVVKAPRQISHLRRLEDVREPTALLRERLKGFAESLGAVLVQLPPNSRLNLLALEQFLELWGEGPTLAFEFRHPSWFVPEVRVILEQHGAALCLADSAERELPPLDVRAPVGFFRLRRGEYSEAEIDAWASRLEEGSWRDCFVFFKHELAAPAYALNLRAALGQSSRPRLGKS